MFKREMKVNLKSFVIWLLVLISIFLIVFILYPTIINNENMHALKDLMKMFPEELLIAFNMDISSIDTAYGWLKSEGFVFVLLIIGSYAAITGSNILLKEENDQTIEYLNSLPIKRNNIIFSKVLCGLIYITLMVLILSLFNFGALLLSQEFNYKEYILLSLTPLFSSYVIYFFCLFLSTFTNKSNKMISLSLGIVLISYILSILSSISKQTEFLKYFSFFTLADIRNVILNTEINPFMILFSISFSVIFLILTILNYNNKDLV